MTTNSATATATATAAEPQGSPSPTPPSSSSPPSTPEATTASAPKGGRAKLVRWTLIGASLSLLFVELGPWPGLLTRRLGLAVGPGGGASAGVALERAARPTTSYRRTGSRIAFDDPEMAEFARHVQFVVYQVGQLANAPMDASGVQKYYQGLVPQLFVLVKDERFPEEKAKEWAEFIAKTPPPRPGLPFDTEPFENDIALAVVTRQVTTGHLSDLVRLIQWYDDASVTVDEFRRSAQHIGFIVPNDLRPQMELSASWRGKGGLADAEAFIKAKLQRGDAAPPRVQAPPKKVAPAKPEEKPARAPGGFGSGFGPGDDAQKQKEAEDALKRLEEKSKNPR